GWVLLAAPHPIPLPAKCGERESRALPGRPKPTRCAMPSGSMWPRGGAGGEGVRPGGAGTVLLHLPHALRAAPLYELVYLSQQIAVDDAEGVLQLGGAPDHALDHRRRLDGADAEPGLGGLAVLELELGRQRHGDLHHLLVALDVAAHAVRRELVLVLR